MKLPNADKLIVEREKIADYLLDSAHPDNGGKAEFFTRNGFQRGQWEILAMALKNLAVTGEVTSFSETLHGKNMSWLAGFNRRADNRFWFRVFG